MYFRLQAVQRWTPAENQKPVPSSAISRGSRNPDDPVAGRMGSLRPVGGRRVLSKGKFFSGVVDHAPAIEPCRVSNRLNTCLQDGSGESVIKVDITAEQDQFLSGHTIDGRVLYPATGYLVSISQLFQPSYRRPVYAIRYSL